MKILRIAFIVLVTIGSFHLINQAVANNKIIHKWQRLPGMPVNDPMSYMPFQPDSTCSGPPLWVCSIFDEADLTGMYPVFTWGNVDTHQIQYSAIKRGKN